MQKEYNKYLSPLSERYASAEMQYLFSPEKKFRTWRKLWIALAETERELGLPITEEQIAELKAHAEDINYEVAEARERDESCLCLRQAVPERKGHHSPRCDQLLRGR